MRPAKKPSAMTNSTGNSTEKALMTVDMGIQVNASCSGVLESICVTVLTSLVRGWQTRDTRNFSVRV
jgi:hypothetical protein